MTVPSHLPQPPPTTFVGRTAELRLLAELFGSRSRLVTLLGPAGIGKSRLALEHAARARGTLPGGVWVVDLTESRTVEALNTAVLSATGAPAGVEPGGSRVALRKRLAALGDALVVLDNFEQLGARGASAVASWLSEAPRLRLLVTSRERLKVEGEAVVEVRPLSLPREGEDASASEAVQLFVDRARAVRHDFRLGRDGERDVARVVRALDGIPLAIELAASRSAVLGPAELLERLPRRFELLSSGGRTRRTLHDAIARSWAALAPHEQSALAQCAVFRSGFSLAAAEAVIDLRRHRRAPPVVDVLEVLREKSLVFTSGADHALRFGLYLSIRDFAERRLVTRGEAAAVRARHARHFVELGRALASEAEAGAPRAMDQLALEADNLLAAIEFGREGGRGALARRALAAEAAAAVAPALSRHSATRVVSLLDGVLSSGPVPPRPQSAALVARGEARRLLGALEEARQDFGRARVLAHRARDRRLEARALAGEGSAMQLRGDLVAADALLEKALGLFAQGGDRLSEARYRVHAGQIRIVLGRLEEAEEQLEAALRLSRALGAQALESHALGALALLALAGARFTTARERADEALGLARRLGDRVQEVAELSTLGMLAIDQRRIDDAFELFGRSRRIAEELGLQRVLGMLDRIIAVAFLLQGRPEQARRSAADAVERLRHTGDRRGESLARATLGALEAARGATAEAERLFSQAERILADVGDPLLGTTARALRTVLDIALGQPPGEAEERRLRELSARSHHLRHALALRDALRATLEGKDGAASALVVGPEARWFRPPGRDEVRFRRARAVRLMLLALVEQRLSSPGKAMTADALFVAGWPGEKVSPDAAANRVYVGVSRLRNMGLRGLLVSRDDGFLIEPTVEVRRDETVR